MTVERVCDGCGKIYRRRRGLRCVLCGHTVCSSCADPTGQWARPTGPGRDVRCSPCDLLLSHYGGRQNFYARTRGLYRTRVRLAWREAGFLDERGRKTDKAKGLLLALKLSAIGGSS